MMYLLFFKKKKQQIMSKVEYFPSVWHVSYFDVYYGGILK